MMKSESFLTTFNAQEDKGKGKVVVPRDYSGSTLILWSDENTFLFTQKTKI